MTAPLARSFNARHPSKAALKEKRRREREAQWEAQARAAEEKRKEHDAEFSDIVEALQRLDINPRRLRDYLAGLD